MKIGYGYKRTEKTLRDLGAEKVYLDKSAERPDRAYLITKGNAFEEGDILVLVHYADLGNDYRDRDRVLEYIANCGVMVQVGTNEPVLYDTPLKRKDFKDQKGGTKTQAEKGRPRVWNPEPDKLAEFAAIWHDPLVYTMAACRHQYAKIFGEPWSEKVKGRVRYRIGGRETPKPPPDAPLDGDE